MSRKSPTDQMAEDIGCLIIALLWMAVVGFFALFIKASQVAPEDKLLKLQPSYVWLWRIEPLDCPACGTINESNMSRCYRCGASLAVPVTTEQQVVTSSNQAPTSPENDTAIGMFIILFLVVGALLYALANLG